ncbi:dolichyl-phosphate-mannose-protein mannosyltransferase [Mytilus galloprovincialis]|uniref:dolichyl-phosphate-mannose--protein mannosyltransferase n=1 Tax=Mytilus galloprovincialis TaxID=29158 RepID=A0A8B6CJ41_MYTGA|nr:dolichyl-phosphate-mannose-protein mannosyltransferase [Mytilus galloprovincialis]
MEEQTTVEGSIANQHKPESDAALDRTSLTESTLDRSLPTPQRLEGDGSPRPSSLDEGRREESSQRSRPFSIQFEVDVVQLLLVILSVATRLWRLGFPRAVVFDELHFAKYASLYLQRIFFFDSHPPLGKMLLALAGGYSGFEGDINFDRIGAEFSPQFPVYQLRLPPAVMGSLVVPLIYQICVELKMSRWSALLAGMFVLLDNALLVQSRFMLMEGMLLFFMCLTIYSFLKFRSLTHREFSVPWFFWLFLTGISFTCTLSVKYVGVFTAIVILLLSAKDFWFMLADNYRSDFNLIKHLIARLTFLIGVPVTFYILMFYIHLSILIKAGPHDNIMTSAFQASLEGGLAALTKGQPLHVSFGSQITLRPTYHTGGKPCWLHSHAHVYPLRYSDGRGSSHQQQVTCYVFKDINNWWIVKHPDSDSMVVDDPPKPIEHGDLIQLVHGITSRALNSHDVAAPITPQNQEVTCYIDYNVTMPAQNLWRVEVINRDTDGHKWQTIKSHIRLVHVNTSQALKSTGKQLPEWGFHQLEISTDRIINQEATVWNVEEHRFTKSVEKDQQAREIAQSEMIPLEPTHLSFWTKFTELQLKMLMGKAEEMEHKYSTEPIEWPFMDKNVAYWMSPNSNAQIHLLGNPVIWYLGTLSVFGYSALLVFYLLRRRRGWFDLTTGEWNHFVFIAELLIGGYFLHYLPFFLTDSTLFLHSYLPCVIFKILAATALIDHLYVVSHRFPVLPSTVKYVTVGIILCTIYSFYKLSVFTYGGTDLTPQQITDLMWRESWDFLIHVRV